MFPALSALNANKSKRKKAVSRLFVKNSGQNRKMAELKKKLSISA
jgi:hypothetical protein